MTTAEKCGVYPYSSLDAMREDKSLEKRFQLFQDRNNDPKKNPNSFENMIKHHDLVWTHDFFGPDKKIKMFPLWMHRVTGDRREVNTGLSGPGKLDIVMPIGKVGLGNTTPQHFRGDEVCVLLVS